MNRFISTGCGDWYANVVDLQYHQIDCYKLIVSDWKSNNNDGEGDDDEKTTETSQTTTTTTTTNDATAENTENTKPGDPTETTKKTVANNDDDRPTEVPADEIDDVFGEVLDDEEKVVDNGYRDNRVSSTISTTHTIPIISSFTIETTQESPTPHRQYEDKLDIQQLMMDYSALCLDTASESEENKGQNTTASLIYSTTFSESASEPEENKGPKTTASPISSTTLSASEDWRDPYDGEYGDCEYYNDLLKTYFVVIEGKKQAERMVMKLERDMLLKDAAVLDAAKRVRDLIGEKTAQTKSIEQMKDS